jgi:L-amino acid N-acyltransferase YncA
VDTWRTTYAAIVGQDYLDRLSYEGRELRWKEILATASEFIFVAQQQDGQIIGFASGGPMRGNTTLTGEINAIYLLERYQRKGIGQRLIAAAARELLARGMRSMIIHVFAANPARAFYEALGGRKVYEGEFMLEGTLIADVAYGWEDIAALATFDQQKDSSKLR